MMRLEVVAWQACRWLFCGMFPRVASSARTMKEAAGSSETSVNMHQATQRNIPENRRARSKCASIVHRSKYCTEVSEEFSISYFREENFPNDLATPFFLQYPVCKFLPSRRRTLSIICRVSVTCSEKLNCHAAELQINCSVLVLLRYSNVPKSNCAVCFLFILLIHATNFHYVVSYQERQRALSRSCDRWG
jgi:hypothetical protein